MKLVLDTNVVISAILRNSATRQLLVHPALELYAPDHLFEEIEEHKDEILEKAGITTAEFVKFVSSLEKLVKILPRRAYAEFLDEAKTAIADPDDAPFLAAAMALGAPSGKEGDCDIWTSDKHFLAKQGELFQKYGVKILKTGDLLALLRK